MLSAVHASEHISGACSFWHSLFHSVCRELTTAVRCPVVEWRLHSLSMYHSAISWLESVFPTTFKPTTQIIEASALSHRNFNPPQPCGSIKNWGNQEKEKPAHTLHLIVIIVTFWKYGCSFAWRWPSHWQPQHFFNIQEGAVNVSLYNPNSGSSFHLFLGFSLYLMTFNNVDCQCCISIRQNLLFRTNTIMTEVSGQCHHWVFLLFSAIHQSIPKTNSDSPSLLCGKPKEPVLLTCGDGD